MPNIAVVPGYPKGEKTNEPRGIDGYGNISLREAYKIGLCRILLR